jgi:hypothetical protein
LRNHDKKYLKVLIQTDPILFGPRTIKNAMRSYSGIRQKQHQRVVIITEDEYDFLHEKIPQSVANIKNLSFPNHRLCLLCPFKKSSVLNFHVIPNQPCIVRCTVKSSNKSQYNFCANALDVLHKMDIKNRFENQTTILYNPLISPGRTCYLPFELSSIFENFVLLKLSTNATDITMFVKDNYSASPFIIKRNEKNLVYDVITEFNGNENYILIMQPDNIEEYFVILNTLTNKPMYFNKQVEIKKFFSDRFRKTDTQYKFLGICKKLLGIDLSEYIIENTIEWLFKHIHEKYNAVFVIDKEYIQGVVYKNRFYMTNLLYWFFKDVSYTITLSDVIKSVQEDK